MYNNGESKENAILIPVSEQQNLTMSNYSMNQSIVCMLHDFVFDTIIIIITIIKLIELHTSNP